MIMPEKTCLEIILFLCLVCIFAKIIFKNMKNYILASTLFFVVCFLVSQNEIAAQKSDFLPDNLVQSFNGKFISAQEREVGTAISENGRYRISYDIGSATDEQRELKNLRFFTEDDLMYTLDQVPGSDVLVSNSGNVVVFDMKYHFKQEVIIHLFNGSGDKVLTKNFKYASLFDFSPGGNKFIVGTDKKLNIIDLETGRDDKVASCSQFAFTQNEEYLVTAFEGSLNLYYNYELVHEYKTGLFYPRAVIIDGESKSIGVIGKHQLKVYSMEIDELKFSRQIESPLSFRDLIMDKGNVVAGIHLKNDGISEGIIHVYNVTGNLIHEQVLSTKTYKTFEKQTEPLKSTSTIDPIPWPFDPFNEVHKVWNHYEQHMGDGSGDWSYLHQGLDLEVPIDEPTYAVEEGWVKLVLTIGGDAYWRVAISPEQVSGYSNGWLYAHIVESSIMVDVGDYVQLHDYLGDIIYWTSSWGHIHFVNIRDQGTIWYYNDDEWGINFNPLLALVPNTDNYAPVIENFSGSSKFGYCTNQTTSFQDPDNLHDEVDIIAKISDYHGDSEWEQPAYKTYYWIIKLPEYETVVPKTIGQILNHSYEMYNSTYYTQYAPLMYYKDFQHPSPPWMNFDRDYWQILTNNNGDSIVEPWETGLALNTAEFADGTYRIVVEAWDEFGNMAIDSQDVVFENFPVGLDDKKISNAEISVFPNPCDEKLTLNTGKYPVTSITILNNEMKEVQTITNPDDFIFGDNYLLNLEALPKGIYYLKLIVNNQLILKKVVKI